MGIVSIYGQVNCPVNWPQSIDTRLCHSWKEKIIPLEIIIRIGVVSGLQMWMRQT